MSIRAKITLWVLMLCLSEAVLLGLIGYSSIAAVSQNAVEMRRITDAVGGARALNVSLIRVCDPARLLRPGEGGSVRAFARDIERLEGQIQTCAASSCHGYRKRPPRMAGELIQSLEEIRAGGTRILESAAPGGPPPLDAWIREVDAPARRLSQATAEMSDTLVAQADDIECASRKTERKAILLVSLATVFCVGMSVAVCRPLARSIARPIERLAEQTRRIEEGDLEVRAEEDAGSLESTLLARSFNRMLDEIVRQRAALLAHQDQLEHTVKARVDELRRKDVVLKRSERMASVGLVAGAVAHDLNNPLTNLLLNAEALLRSVPEGSPDRRIVEDMMESALRCRRIALDVRNLGREYEIARVPCDLPGIVEEAVRLLRHVWEPRRVSVACDLRPAPSGCLCSPTLMLQVAVNLVENAIQASPEGGTVLVRLREAGGGVVLEVEDDGPGIPEKDRVAVFRPFFTTKPEGTGLGLAICRRIMERHGGSVELESRTEAEAPGGGHGTLLRIRLPAGKEGGGA